MKEKTRQFLQETASLREVGKAAEAYPRVPSDPERYLTGAIHVVPETIVAQASLLEKGRTVVQPDRSRGRQRVKPSY